VLQVLYRTQAFRRYLAPAYGNEWVVYAKRPFAGPAQVLEYVGRYTHRAAISNNRLVSIDDGKVRFRWKDYRQKSRQKVMTLDGGEFIRRFLIHVLPEGFHRIRYYGFLGNCHRARKLALCRELLGMVPVESIIGRRSNRSKPNRPPDRSGPVWTARAVVVPAQGPRDQIGPMLAARTTGWRSGEPQLAAGTAPMVPRQRNPKHSKPIALASGGAV